MQSLSPDGGGGRDNLEAHRGKRERTEGGGECEREKVQERGTLRGVQRSCHLTGR